MVGTPEGVHCREVVTGRLLEAKAPRQAEELAIRQRLAFGIRPGKGKGGAGVAVCKQRRRGVADVVPSRPVSLARSPPQCRRLCCTAQRAAHGEARSKALGRQEAEDCTEHVRVAKVSQQPQRVRRLVGGDQLAGGRGSVVGG